MTGSTLPASTTPGTRINGFKRQHAAARKAGTKAPYVTKITQIMQAAFYEASKRVEGGNYGDPSVICGNITSQRNPDRLVIDPRIGRATYSDDVLYSPEFSAEVGKILQEWGLNAAMDLHVPENFRRALDGAWTPKGASFIFMLDRQLENTLDAAYEMARPSIIERDRAYIATDFDPSGKSKNRPDPYTSVEKVTEGAIEQLREFVSIDPDTKRPLDPALAKQVLASAAKSIGDVAKEWGIADAGRSTYRNGSR